MGKRALITGITGQDGAYLSAFLMKKGYEVYGVARVQSPKESWRLCELGIEEKVQLVDARLQDAESMQSMLKEIQPDEVYNLASLNFFEERKQKPEEAKMINAEGPLHLLDAIVDTCPKARFFQASTAEMYGTPETTPQDEETPLHPKSEYGKEKVIVHEAVHMHREKNNVFGCCGILFNHTSPLRGIDYVVRKITDGVARIKLGLTESIALGNLEAKRDWGFAGDYIEAMWLMLQHDAPDDFVLATGETHSIREVFDTAFDAADIDDWSSYITQDPAFMRPAEVQEIRGNADKAKRVLGWEPTVGFEELVKMMVEADVKRLATT